MRGDFFFYQSEGKTVGPVGVTELRGRIREGRVRLFDLILKEGDAAWRMALEHGEFKDDFKDKSKTVFKERPWVCLQRKSADGFNFLTTGPFSGDEVREGLLAGRISYTDYAWKSGFSEWRRIGLLADFNPRLKAAPRLADEEPSASDLLRNVVELKRPRPPVPEALPVEALTPDLTKSDPVADVPPAIPQPTPVAPIPVRPLSVARSEPKTKRRRKNVPWLDWGIVVILVVVLGAVTVVLSRNVRRQRTLDVPASTVLETVPPKSSVPVEYAGEDEAESKTDSDETDSAQREEEEVPSREARRSKESEDSAVSPPKAPTELFLAVQNRSNNQARIELRTNGTKEFPVLVQVVGVPGGVTSGPSYYRYLKIRPKGDIRQPLDLSKIKLPQGRLTVRASTGDLRKEAKLNVGVTDPTYRQSINRVRKLYAFAIWSERLQLVKMSALLETRTTQALHGQKFNIKGLESLAQVSILNGQRYAFFDDWIELKSAMEEARGRPSAEVVAKVKKVRDKMVAYTVWK